MRVWRGARRHREGGHMCVREREEAICQYTCALYICAYNTRAHLDTERRGACVVGPFLHFRVMSADDEPRARVHTWGEMSSGRAMLFQKLMSTLSVRN